jgi:hypothetical protein
MRRKEKAEASGMAMRLCPWKKRLRCGIVGFVGWLGLIRPTGSAAFVALLLEMAKASTAQYT